MAASLSDAGTPRKAVSPARMMTGSMMNPMAKAPASPLYPEVPHDGDVAEDADGDRRDAGHHVGREPEGGGHPAVRLGQEEPAQQADGHGHGGGDGGDDDGADDGVPDAPAGDPLRGGRVGEEVHVPGRQPLGDHVGDDGHQRHDGEAQEQPADPEGDLRVRACAAAGWSGRRGLDTAGGARRSGRPGCRGGRSLPDLRRRPPRAPVDQHQPAGRPS